MLWDQYVWVIMRCLIGTVCVITGATMSFDAISGLDDTFGTDVEWDSMQFVQAVLILCLILPVVQIYSIISNTLRVKGTHCAKDKSVLYQACGGYAAHRNDDKTCFEFLVEITCLGYSHVILFASWVAVAFTSAMTVFGAVIGTFVYIMAELCDAADFETIAAMINVTAKSEYDSDFASFDAHLSQNLSTIEMVYCEAPDDLRSYATDVFTGPAIVTLGMVAFLVFYSTIYKVHQELSEKKEIAAGMKALGQKTVSIDSMTPDMGQPSMPTDDRDRL